MTRDEIIGMGVTPDLARAISTYIKTNLPLSPRIADPTSIINNEGVIFGWSMAANFIEVLSIPLQDQNPEKQPMYSEPSRK